MADTGPQPDPANDASLEQQLDEVLRQIQEIEPGLIPATNAAKAASPTTPAEPATAAPDPDGKLDAQLDELLAAAQAQATDPLNDASSTGVPTPTTNDDPDSLAGDELAAQIQSLLDDAKRTSEVATPAPQESLAADATPHGESLSVEQLLQHAAGEEKTWTQQIAQDGGNPATPVPAPAAPPALKQLDAELAESADHAMAGDFETVTEVLQAEQRNTDGPATTQGEELAGDFETPESVIQAGPAPLVVAAAGSAGSVARELDTQPEARPHAAAPLAPAVAAVAQDLATPATRRARKSSRRIDWAAWNDRLLRLCATVNRPLMSLSPEWRGTVGMVALLQVFLASVLLLGKIASVVRG